MGDIAAGIVCTTRFCLSGDKAFGKYIDYIDRDEATKKENIDKFNLFEDYLDYVGDTRKLGSLFTRNKDNLSDEDKKLLKAIFLSAQKNGSLMWQTVISFDNEYLQKHGLYDKENQALNEARLKVAAKKAISSMLKKEGLENALWAASFHYNTDNIHIHIATVEPIPMRKKELYRQYEMTSEGKYKKIKDPKTGKLQKVPLRDTEGKVIYKEEYRGKFKESSLHGKDGLRSIMRSEIEKNKEETIAITQIIRDIVADKKEREFLAEDRFAIAMKKLYQDLKENSKGKSAYLNMWSYNTNFMNSFKTQIDDISRKFIKEYHSDAFNDLLAKLSKKEARYKEGYGGDSLYVDNKIRNELFPRLGNAILKELKDYERLQQAKRKEVTSAEKLLSKGEILEGLELLNTQADLGSDLAQNALGFIYLKGEYVNKDINEAKKYFVKSKQQGNDLAEKMLKHINSGSSKSYSAGHGVNFRSSSKYDFARALSNLKRSLSQTIENYKAREAYQELQREIEERGMDL